MFLYLPIETTQSSQYCGHYLTFGLAAVEIFPCSAALVEFIADISTDKKQWHHSPVAVLFINWIRYISSMLSKILFDNRKST